MHNETVITFFTFTVSKNDDRLNTLRYSIFLPLCFLNNVFWLYDFLSTEISDFI